MADTRLVIRGENRTRGAFNQVNKSLDGMNRSLSGLKTAAASFVGVLAGGALARVASNTLDFADRVNKLNISLGASTEFLSQIRFAAEQTGGSFEGAAKNIRRLQDATGEAVKGTKAQADAFKALGIDVQRFARLRPEDQIEVLADQLSSLENQTDRLNIANDIFGGRGAQEFLQLAEQGSAGIRSLREEASALGQTLSTEQAAGAAAANDALNRLKRSFTGVAQELIVNVAPNLTEVANFIQSNLPQAVNFATSAFSTLASGFRLALAGITQVLKTFVDGAASAAEFFGRDQFAGGLRAASAALADFRDKNIEAGFASAESAKENFKLALGYKEITTAATEAAGAIQSAGDTAGVVTGRATGLAGIAGGSSDGDGKSEADKALREAERRKDQLAGIVEDGIRAGGEEGAKGVLQSLLTALQNQAIKAIASTLANSISGGGGGSTGGSGGFFSSLFGFGDGGSFRVGGSGGRDSQVAAFRVTPGEEVNITRPGQSSGGGTNNFTFQVDARGATDPAQTQRAVQQAVLKAEKRIADLMQRGRYPALG